jgi:putative membrane protein
MSLLTRVATMAAMAAGALAVVAGPAAAAPSQQDTQFLQQAHQTNLAEIAAGELAQQKGNSQIVRDLGARFVSDHTALDQSLRPVAQALGVPLPSTPNAQQQAVAARLRAASGPAFDTLFVTTQFAGHTQAMQAGQTEIAQGSDPRAIEVARDAAPVIAAHHSALQDAANTLGIPLSVDAGTGGQAAARRPYLATGGLVLSGSLLIGFGLRLRLRHRNRRRVHVPG